MAPVERRLLIPLGGYMHGLHAASWTTLAPRISSSHIHLSLSLSLNYIYRTQG